MGVFNGMDSLNVAQFLGGQTSITYTPESAQRAAISRAYFAAYGHAFHHEVDGNRYHPEKNAADNHRGLRVHFAKKIKEQKIAAALEDLRRWRNQCDYGKIFVGNLPKNTEQALEKAKYIIDCLL
jgi:hypothetical protein